MANDGLIVDSDGKPRGLDEAIDWQLDKTVSPHRMVFGTAGRDGLGAWHAMPYKLQAIKITESGSDIYIGMAAIGSVQADPVWRCLKIAQSGGDTTITYADADDNYDNIATDLTLLSYS